MQSKALLYIHTPYWEDEQIETWLTPRGQLGRCVLQRGTQSSNGDRRYRRSIVLLVFARSHSLVQNWRGKTAISPKRFTKLRLQSSQGITQGEILSIVQGVLELQDENQTQPKGEFGTVCESAWNWRASLTRRNSGSRWHTELRFREDNHPAVP